MRSVAVGMLASLGLLLLDTAVRSWAGELVLTTWPERLAGTGTAIGTGAVLGAFVGMLVAVGLVRGHAADRVRALAWPQSATNGFQPLAVVAGMFAALPCLFVAWRCSAAHLAGLQTGAHDRFAVLKIATAIVGAITCFVVVHRWTSGRVIGRVRISIRVAGLLVVSSAVGLVGLAAWWGYARLVADGIWPVVLVSGLVLLFAGGMGIAAGLRVPPSRVIALAVVGLGSWIAVGQDSWLRTATVGELAPSRWLADATRFGWDVDGDGFSPVLGGGDCDDLNTEVHPQAVDVPSNGRDEDCDGDDATGALIPAVLADGGEAEPGYEHELDVESLLGRRPLARAVLLITVDSLRPDHLGVYGYDRPTSPHLDEWAQQAIVFDRAWSTAPGTAIALPSLMSGRTTSETPWRKDSRPLEPEASVLLVGEALREAGIQSHAISTFLGLTRPVGMARGFDSVDGELARQAMSEGKDTGEAVADKAIAFLEAHVGDRFFLWLHFMEPHSPYVDHPGAVPFGDTPLDRYDAEIRYVDTHVHRVLLRLAELGLDETTAVVLTADHGERRGHHGNMGGHGVVDRGSLRIPLIVRVPGLPGRRLSCPVSLKDVSRTTMRLLDVPRAHEFPAVDLVPSLADGECDPLREVVAEKTMEPGGVRGQWTLIGPRFRYYEHRLRGIQQLFELNVGVKREAIVPAARHTEVRAVMRESLTNWHRVQEQRQVHEALGRVVVDAVPKTAITLRLEGPPGLEIVGVELDPEPVVRPRFPLLVRVYVRVTEPQTKAVALAYDWGELTESHRLPVWHLPEGVLPAALWPVGKIVYDELTVKYHRNGRDGEVMLGLGFTVNDEPFVFEQHGTSAKVASVRFDSGEAGDAP